MTLRIWRIFLFQSTLPMRGATIPLPMTCIPSFRFQSTLPMRGATAVPAPQSGGCGFQSTLPMRGATISVDENLSKILFQSTLPMRGATFMAEGLGVGWDISIHTPHAGSDKWRNYKMGLWNHFNPHSPCGERRKCRSCIVVNF